MKQNRYMELRNRQQKEVDAFPLKFAFSDKQFEEAMKELGLRPSQTDKVVSIGYNGFCLKEDAPKFAEMVKRHQREHDEEVAKDKTGDGYIYDMFLYELENHEYGYTGDTEDALEALGLTAEEVVNDERLNHGLCKAVKKIRTFEWC